MIKENRENTKITIQLDIQNTVSVILNMTTVTHLMFLYIFL